MKKIAFYLAALAFLASCGNKAIDSEDGPNPFEPLRLSTKQTEFVAAGHTFDFNFIRNIDKASENDYIVSPQSMQFLLAMLVNAAEGQTAAEIFNVLGYGNGELDDVNTLDRMLLDKLPSIDRKTTLSIANALVVNQTAPLKESYAASMKKVFDAEIANMDFRNVQAVLGKVNGWCSDKTGGMIKKIIDEDNVRPDILAFLMNAIYFKGSWADKFNKDATRQRDFRRADGTTVKLPMMSMTHEFVYGETKLFQFVRLPYGNGAFTMTVLLPLATYTTSDIASWLNSETWAGLHSSRFEVDLWLPRFETKYHIKLNELLSAMGMPRAFMNGVAEFHAMSDEADCLDFVQQHAMIKVNEEGTEAAAVSSAGMEKYASAGPSEYKVFHADRPFLYIISESSTGSILFAGRYGADTKEQ